MAEQKIFPQQITVTGSTNGQVLTANTTSNTAYWAPANSWLTTVTSKNIIPAAANTYSLGSPTRRYKDLFLSGATMYLGNTTLSSTKKGALTIQAQGSATVQTLVSNSYLTSVYIANTTARTLISDRLQVANAVATYQTKSIERAALANTNLRINLLNTNLTGTNTAIRALDTAKLSVANAITLYATKASPTTSGLLAHTGRATISTNLLVSGNTTLSGTLVANGTVGTAGYYLRTSGTGVYWSPASSGAGGTFTGGTVSGATTFSSGVTLSSTLTAGASVGTSGQALVSTGTGVQWGALSPGYNYSSQFNGSSTFLTTPTSAAFNLNGVDWTIECWFYATATPPANITNIIQSYQGTNNWQPYVGIGLNTNLTFQIVINAVGAATTQTFTLNSWNHIALVRSGGVVKFYLNGVATSISTTSDITSSNLSWFIGKVDNVQGGGGYVYYYTGYLSNVRIVKGTAVYTAAFTPPTSPLSAITNTSLLTCTSITPTADLSTNNHALTNTGPVTTTATLSPFTSTTVSIPTASLTAVRQQFTGDGSTTTFAVAGGYTPNAISVFVNGVLLRNGTEVTVTNGSTVVFAIAPLSGALIDVIGTVPTTYSSITPVSYSVGFSSTSQALTLAQSTAFDLPADLTVEAWVYFTSFNGTGSENTIVGKWGDSAQYAWIIQYLNTGNLRFYPGNSGSLGTAYSAAWSPSASTWYHIAFTRSGSSIKFYVNGIQVGTTGTNSDNLTASTVLSIGRNPATGAPQSMFGYVSNLRIVKGLAVYTNNFTVPSSPLAITQSASGAYIQAITGTQTALLTCNGPTIIDGSTNAFTITNNGAAPVSTAIVPTFTNVTINAPTLYYPANYLIVAGGGGGGGTQTVTGGGGYLGGGGGAGGLLTGITTLITGTTCTVTVGSGGAAGTSSGSPTVGSSGTNSVLVTSTTITAIGGGGGGYGGSGSTGAGVSGGSGGGAGSATGTGGSGTTGQGFAGGSSASTTTGYASGGGGSSAVGTSATSSAVNAGGAGTASSITGTSVNYAAGGNGGGGSANATTNTGNGGPTASSNGGAYAGGSGVVILAIPSTSYTGRTTGSPTVTTNGIYTVLTFTASGTYTA